MPLGYDCSSMATYAGENANVAATVTNSDYRLVRNFGCKIISSLRDLIYPANAKPFLFENICNFALKPIV
jgi:hypothetical protein